MSYKEIEKILLKKKRQIPKDICLSYLGKFSKQEFLGLKVPTIRDLVKKELKTRDKDFWVNAIEKSSYYEVKTSGFYALCERSNNYDLSLTDFKRIFKVVDNWPQADTWCSLFSHYLENDKTGKYKELLQSWNKSKNPWKRRVSLVGLFDYAYFRKKYPAWSFVKSQVSTLLDDNDEYVQKGIGWTLREAGHIYPVQAKKFIVTNLEKISPIAYTAAVEKWPKEERAILAIKRREMRKKK